MVWNQCVCVRVCVCVCFCVRVCMESPHEPIESGWANGAAGPLEPCGGSPQKRLRGDKWLVALVEFSSAVAWG